MIERKCNPDRIIYFDILKILAALGVIIIHVSSEGWKISNPMSENFVVRTVYMCVVYWAVPVFVMISGALFLSKEKSTRKIYRNNIMPLIIAFLFWSGVYAILPFSTTRQDKSMLESFISGEYHMWFVFMIIGLYMIIPFLRKIIQSTRLTYYFLTLSFVFAFLAPQTLAVLDTKYSGIAYFVNEDIKYLNLHMVLGYTGYFILGYLLHTKALYKKVRIFIYILGCAGLLVTVVATTAVSMKAGKPSMFFLDYLSPNVLCMSCAVFCFAKEHFNIAKHERTKTVLKNLSEATFGLYLIHVLIITIFSHFFNISSISFDAIISVPVVSVLIYLISMLISLGLTKIPFVGKYIV